jgi:hypothetical protein
MKIAFSGKICSFKSTSAKIVVEMLEHKTVVLSFAKRIKEIASDLFDYDETQFKNRALLQNFGKAIRDLDEYAWIRSLDKQVKALTPATNVVIDDLRFPDEFIYCKQSGFVTIRLEVNENIQRGRIIAAYGYEHLDRINDYSETALDDNVNNFDYVVDANDPEKAFMHIKHIIELEQKKQLT